MFTKIFLLFISCAFVSSSESVEPNEITYEWLISHPEYSTDHIPSWQCLFNTIKVRGFLECGCGMSTKYFLDHAEKVISIEYITPGYGDRIFKEYVSLFGHIPNWLPMTYNEDYRSNSFNNACAYQCSMHKDYALIDSTYLKELDKHYKKLMKKAQDEGYNIDVAFVNSGVYIRGDMVKVLLANNIPIVAAHHTASDAGTTEIKNLYGWNKVVTPTSYEKIYLPIGQGTTFWISKQLPDLIASMTVYRNSIVQAHNDLSYAP